MNKKSKLQMISVEKLHPHPKNPRKVIGDVSELAESIKANGILQNLTVVPNNDNWDDFTVIIGHNFEDDESIDSYISEHWSDNSGRMLMAAAYALCQTNYSSFSYISVNYSDKTFSRKNNLDLNRFYVLLCKLGYVMSDEEIQLRDGTHPIFTIGETN
jgi:hypothetical protein|nr:MAG TPA: chromosome partitioning protein [Caudoviricetes sp.]